MAEITTSIYFDKFLTISHLLGQQDACQYIKELIDPPYPNVDVFATP